MLNNKITSLEEEKQLNSDYLWLGIVKLSGNDCQFDLISSSVRKQFSVSIELCIFVCSYSFPFFFVETKMLSNWQLCEIKSTELIDFDIATVAFLLMAASTKKAM